MTPEELIKLCDDAAKATEKPHALSRSDFSSLNRFESAGFARSSRGIARARRYAKLWAALEPILRIDDHPLSIEEARELARDADEALATTGGT